MSYNRVAFLVAGSYRFGRYCDAKGAYPPSIDDDFKKGTFWHPFIIEFNKYIAVGPVNEDVVKYLNKRASIKVAHRSINIIITGIIGRLIDRHDRQIVILEINKPELLLDYAILPQANVIKGDVCNDTEDNEELHNGVNPMTDQSDLKLIIQSRKSPPPPKNLTPPRAPPPAVIEHVLPPKPSAPPMPKPSALPAPKPSAPPMPKPSALPAPKPPAPKPNAPIHTDPAPVEDSSCVVCMEEPRTIAFGCGHIVCGTCAPKLLLCPICRTKIGLRIKLFV